VIDDRSQSQNAQCCIGYNGRPTYTLYCATSDDAAYVKNRWSYRSWLIVSARRRGEDGNPDSANSSIATFCMQTTTTYHLFRGVEQTTLQNSTTRHIRLGLASFLIGMWPARNGLISLTWHGFRTGWSDLTVIYDIYVLQQGVVLCEVNCWRWRFVMLFK